MKATMARHYSEAFICTLFSYLQGVGEYQTVEASGKAIS
jgi:hypothetical protein